MPASIRRVTEPDLPELLPLLRAYCDFYEAAPSDDALLTLCRALIAGPDREGVQFLAREEDGQPVGFATVFWSWSTTRGARLGTMNDLFVDEGARGSGLADRLIEACANACRAHGAPELEWQTALDNHRAQAVYERVGGRASRWLSYALEV